MGFLTDYASCGEFLRQAYGNDNATWDTIDRSANFLSIFVVRILSATTDHRGRFASNHLCFGIKSMDTNPLTVATRDVMVDVYQDGIEQRADISCWRGSPPAVSEEVGFFRARNILITHLGASALIEADGEMEAKMTRWGGGIPNEDRVLMLIHDDEIRNMFPVDTIATLKRS